MSHRFSLALAAVLASAACGTTVPLAQQQTVAAGSGLEAPGTAVTSPGQGTVGSGSYDSVGSGQSSGSSGPMSPGGAGTPASSASGGPGGVAARTPVKAGAPVEVGFFVAQDLGPFLATAGLSGLSSGNGPNQAKAATAMVNASGGLAGHPVKQVVYELKSSQGTQDSQAQAACNLFFVDHKAVAVVSDFPYPILQECARKAGVPFTSSLQSTMTDRELAAFPNVALVDQVERARGIRNLIPALKSQGYFTPRGAEVVKVGLLTQNGHGFDDVPDQVEAALAAQGVELAATAVIDVTDSGAAQSSASSAVLTFQAAQVNHVVMVEDHGGAMTFFLLNARSQSYYPRLGLSSYEIPQIAALVLPKETFQDALGIGWLPTFDVLLSEADKSTNAPARTCLDLMRKQGEDVNNSGSRSYALGICDSLLTLQAAWKGRALGLASFTSGLAALGSSYPSLMAPFGTDFSRRRDGATRARPLGYDTSCTCFHYTGPQLTLS